MPLTSKGKKIMAAMVKQYGKQKGKEVFYASINKGTIEGVEETKMSYIDRVNELLNERNKENKAKKDAYISSRGGRDNAPQGVYSDQEAYADNPHGSEGSMRGVRRRGAKPSKDQTETHRLGLKRSLKAKHSTPSREDSHTVYQHIGILMAEALGFVTEGIPPYSASAKRHAPRRKTKPMFGQNPDGSPIVKPGQKQRKIPGTPFTTPKLTPEQEAQLRAQSGRRKPVEEGEEPTGEDLKKANKDVHTRKRVKGETPKETKDFDQEVERTMGKKRVGAEGGIEGLKAKIRAAGQRSRR
jgi:hypothetical protein